MDVLVLASAAAVSVVLAAAAVGKVRDPGGVAAALPGLGISDRWTAPIAIGLPIVEALAAVALWVPPARRIGATASAALLAVFLVVVARAVLRGDDVRCACFGSSSAATLSWRSVLRNVVLTAAAVLAAAVPATWGAAADQAGGVAILVLGGALVALGAALALSLRFQIDLFGRYGEILNRLEAIEGGRPAPAVTDTLIEPGTLAPAVAVAELDAGPRDLAELWADDGSALVVFTNPACGSCRSLMPVLAKWAVAHPDTSVAVVSPQSQRRTRDEHPAAPIHWIVDRETAAFEAFGATRTPTGVLVSGGVVTEVARGAAQVEAMLDGLAMATLTLGEVELAEADGTPVKVADVVAPDGALLFWNPGCPHCRGMLPELELTDGVVVVSVTEPGVDPGTPPDWKVVYDRNRLAMRICDAPGTPSLVRLAGGRPDGPAAVGSIEVLAAAGTSSTAGAAR